MTYAVTVHSQEVIGSQVTPDLVVSSIPSNYQDSSGGQKAAHITKPVCSGGIIGFIASTKSALDEVLRLSEYLLRFSSNSIDLVPTFLIQQVTFENTCKVLLSANGRNRQDVELMFENPSQSIWADSTTENNLRSQLGRFYGLFLRTLEYMRRTLSGLQTGLRSLITKIQAVRKQLWPVQSTSPGFSSIDLSPRLKTLRNFNDLLFSLARQAVCSARDYAPYRISENLGNYTNTTTASPSICDHSDCMSQASQALFMLVSKVWSYCGRGNHKMSISTKLDGTIAGGLPPPKSIHFNVVFSCSSSAEYRLSMKVASEHFCTCHSAADAEDWDYSQGCIRPGVTRRSSQASPVLTPCTDRKACQSDCSASSLGVCAGSVRSIARDLSAEQDLCLYLRNSCEVPGAAKTDHCSCLGYLAMENGIKFVVYNIFDGERCRETSYSLDDVLERANTENRTIPVEERLRTATHLATGVLHFHSSPLLRPVWSSKDIHYIDIDGSSQQNNLGEPFLQVSLEASTHAHCTIGIKNPDALRSSLSSLGLALLEIAFSAPWRHLQLQEDVTRDLSEKERNFLNLMRLSETVSRELGLSYASVVQACLHELFGPHGTKKLGTVELYELLRNIVMELNECWLAVSEDLDDTSSSNSKSVMCPQCEFEYVPQSKPNDTDPLLGNSSQTPKRPRSTPQTGVGEARKREEIMIWKLLCCRIKGSATILAGNYVGRIHDRRSAASAGLVEYHIKRTRRLETKPVQRWTLHDKVKRVLQNLQQDGIHSLRIQIVWGHDENEQSQLVLNYIRKHCKKYPAIFLIDGIFRESVEQNYMQIYQLLRDHQIDASHEIFRVEDAVPAVKEWFNGHQGLWLVVLESRDWATNEHERWRSDSGTILHKSGKDSQGHVVAMAIFIS